MFTMKIVDSDAFLDMPLSTQCLYFHLNMRADDDGFIGNPKKIMRMIGASEDDLKILLAKKFLIIFENNIVVIKHWWMHNTLIKDRYHETSYTDEKNQLKIKDNNSYTLDGNGTPLKCITDDQQNVNEMLTECITDDQQNVNSNLGLNLDKDLNLDKEEPKKIKHKYGSYKNVLLTDDEYSKLQKENNSDTENIINHYSELKEMKGYKYKSDYLAIKKWGINAYYQSRLKNQSAMYKPVDLKNKIGLEEWDGK